MDKLKSLIYKIVSENKVQIEKSFSRRFNLALDNEDNKSITPTMLASLGDFSRLYKILNLKPGQILVSQISINQLELINIKDNLLIKTIVKDVFEQSGTANTIGFLFIIIFGYKGSKLAFITEKVLCIRGGFPRGNK
jgi:hypothetical protein